MRVVIVMDKPFYIFISRFFFLRIYYSDPVKIEDALFRFYFIGIKYTDDLVVYDRLVFAQCSQDRKSTRLNSSHVAISYAVFCLNKKKRAAGAVGACDPFITLPDGLQLRRQLR